MRRTLAVTATLLLVAATAGVFLVRHLLRPESVRALFQTSLQNSWRGQSSVGAARVELFPPAVGVHDVRLATSDGSRLLAGVRSVMVVPRLRDLLRGNLTLDTLVIEGPTLDLAQDAEGQLALTALARAGAPSTTATTPSPSPPAAPSMTVQIDRVVVVGLRVVLPGAAAAPGTTLGPLGGEFSVKADSGLTVTGRLSLPSTDLVVPGLTWPLRTLGETLLDLDHRNGTTVATLTLPGAETQVPGLGLRQVGGLTARATVHPDGRVALDPASLELRPVGRATLVAALNPGPAGPPTLTADVAFLDVPLRDFLGDALAPLGTSTGLRKGLHLERFGATLRRGGDGVLHLMDGRGRLAGGGTLTLAGRLAGIEIPDLTVDLTGLPLYPLVEELLAPYEFGSPMKSLSCAQLRMTVNATGAVVSQATFTMGQGTKVLSDARLSAGVLEGSVKVLADGSDIFRVLKLTPPSELAGILTGALTLSGTPMAPVLRGSLTSPSLTYRHPSAPALPLENVTGVLAYADLALSLDDLTGQFFGGRLSGRGTLDLTATPFRYEFGLDSVEVSLAQLSRDLPLVGGRLQGRLRAVTSGKGAGTALGGLTAAGSLTATDVTLADAASALTPAVTGDGPVRAVAAAALARLLAAPGRKDLGLATVTSSIAVADGAMRFNDLAATGAVGLSGQDLAVRLDDASLGGTVTLALPVEGRSPVPVPVDLHGTLLAPKLQIDGAGLKGHVGADLLSGLANRLIGTTTTATTTAPAKPADAARSLLRGLVR